MEVKQLETAKQRTNDLGENIATAQMIHDLVIDSVQVSGRDALVIHFGSSFHTPRMQTLLPGLLIVVRAYFNSQLDQRLAEIEHFQAVPPPEPNVAPAEPTVEQTLAEVTHG